MTNVKRYDITEMTDFFLNFQEQLKRAGIPFGRIGKDRIYCYPNAEEINISIIVQVSIARNTSCYYWSENTNNSSIGGMTDNVQYMLSRFINFYVKYENTP